MLIMVNPRGAPPRRTQGAYKADDNLKAPLHGAFLMLASWLPRVLPG